MACAGVPVSDVLLAASLISDNSANVISDFI